MLRDDVCDVMLFANGWNACADIGNAVLREGVDEVKEKECRQGHPR